MAQIAWPIVFVAWAGLVWTSVCGSRINAVEKICLSLIMPFYKLHSNYMKYNNCALKKKLHPKLFAIGC